MPAPLSNLSTDRFFYDNLCDPLAAHICFIHPNVVTFAGAITSIIIAYIIVKSRRTPPYIIIPLMFIRAFLDCMDGAIARRCETSSDAGKYLDFTADVIFVLSVGGAVIYRVLRKGKRHSHSLSLGAWATIAVVGTIMISYVARMVMMVFFKSQTSSIDRSVVRTIWHDNTIVIATLMGIAVCYV